MNRCPCEQCQNRITFCRDTCDVYWSWYEQMEMTDTKRNQKRKKDKNEETL